MNKEPEYTQISKFLSLVLRHKPETIGLTLDASGWADTRELLEKMKAHRRPITCEVLQQVVATNNKSRFSFNEDQTRIRANQGHSLAVDLNLEEAIPPEYLYHGTGEKSVSAILEKGLEKGRRHHVHLSADQETALAVGKRHGKPRVFRVAARQMQQEGLLFYQSQNHVWLVDQVPARYLQLLPEKFIPEREA